MLFFLSLNELLEISFFQVDPLTGHFIDEFGRVRIFHGVNVVYVFSIQKSKIFFVDSHCSSSFLDPKHPLIILSSMVPSIQSIL